ncbi:MAG: polysaccharide export outer membrane protein [Bradymonadia bacterium]|jgi:polysaccharide export outer membrane protein
MNWYAATALLTLAATVGGCSSPVSPDYPRWATMPYEGPALDLLGEGDRFSLRVYQEPDMSGEFVVSQGGVIAFPLIGEVTVLARRCSDIEGEVAERLADGYLRHPSVSCQVEEMNSLGIVISGEVTSGGLFPFSSNLTIIEAVAMANGLTPNAAEDRVIVSREVDGEMREFVVPFKQVVSGRAPNFRLWPNDSIFVPSYRLIP